MSPNKDPGEWLSRRSLVPDSQPFSVSRLRLACDELPKHSPKPWLCPAVMTMILLTIPVDDVAVATRRRHGAPRLWWIVGLSCLYLFYIVYCLHDFAFRFRTVFIQRHLVKLKDLSGITALLTASCRARDL